MKQLTDEVFEQIVASMVHARTFIATREKMHPQGIELYDETLAALDTAQPERAPLSDQQKRILFECVEQVKDGNELDYWLLGFEAAEIAHGIKQGGQHD